MVGHQEQYIKKKGLLKWGGGRKVNIELGMCIPKFHQNCTLFKLCTVQIVIDLSEMTFFRTKSRLFGSF